MWAKIKYAINNSLGKTNFAPIDSILQTISMASAIDAYDNYYEMNQHYSNSLNEDIFIHSYGQDIPESANYSKVVLDPSVNIISPKTFSGYANLNNIKLPPRVNAIGLHAFKDCKALRHITFPRALKFIDAGAFLGCENLSVVTFMGIPDTISSDCFLGAGVKIIYVPWKAGQIPNAPWGARNAKIIYEWSV